VSKGVTSATMLPRNMASISAEKPARRARHR
jgi:hypothetical protein